MNPNLKTRPKTEEELLDEMNRQLKSGIFYPDDVAMKLVKIARERKCRISELPQELKEKVFSEIKNEEQNSEE